MNVLYIANIVGKPGIFTLKNTLPLLKEKYKADFIIANANMATSTGGLGKTHAQMLHKLGINALTLGDMVFARSDLVLSLSSLNYIARPFNLPKASPGNEYIVLKGMNGESLSVVSLLGVIGRSKIIACNPFPIIEDLIYFLKQKTKHILIDFASHTTGEKKTLIFMLRGKVSAIIGSGTSVATNDLSIFESPTPFFENDDGKCYNSIKTAYITDAGRTGSYNSVGGYEALHKIEEYLTCLPSYSRECWEDLVLQGIFMEFNDEGSAIDVKRVFERCENDKERHGIKNSRREK